MKKIVLSLLGILLGLSVFPAALAANTGGITTGTTISPTEALRIISGLVTSYEARIAQLEAENQTMKYQLEKGLSNTGIIKNAPVKPLLDITSTTPEKTPVLSGSVASGSTVVPTPSVTLTGTDRQKAFITQMHIDWSRVRTAYDLPETALIAGYEFVQTGALDHVFVGILSSEKYTGSLYEYKILYQFDTKTYARKLIGFFQLDHASGKYMTKKGSNPFAGVSRAHILDPYRTPPGVEKSSTGTVAIPSSPVLSGSTTQTQTGTMTATPPVIARVTMAEIQKAYDDRRYLPVISLSNTYLTQSEPSLDVYKIRYRTFFIIGKYNDSLAEITKIQKLMGYLDRTIACDAQVIATYSKNTSLISTYTALCKK